MPNLAKVKSAPTTVKNHVKRNRVSYALGGALIGAIWLQQRNAREFYAFLEEKGIDPLEYTCPEWYEEIMNAK